MVLVDPASTNGSGSQGDTAKYCEARDRLKVVRSSLPRTLNEQAEAIICLASAHPKGSLTASTSTVKGSSISTNQLEKALISLQQLQLTHDEMMSNSSEVSLSPVRTPRKESGRSSAEQLVPLDSPNSAATMDGKMLISASPGDI
jgi:hypothetical protein